MKKRIISSFVLISILFSCDTSMEELITTEDLLLGKWQLESYTKGEETVEISACELLRTINFSENELTVDEYIESFGGLSCVLESSVDVNYYIKDNVIKTIFVDLIIEEITINELHLIIINDNDSILKEKYIKIN